MPDIKTRAVVEKTVKTIDKSVIAAQRMKSAYVQAKEKTVRTISPAKESPEEYAADRVSNGMDAAAFEGVHQLDRQGRKGLEATKANLAKAKEQFQRKRLTDPLKKQRQKTAGEAARQSAEIVSNPQRAANPIRRPADGSARVDRAAHKGQSSIKTVERAGKTVKQSARSTGRATAKTAKGTVKTVKIAEKTAKTSIKASQQAEKAAQRTARTAKAAAQAARASAKAAVTTAKAAVKATIAAVKAMIAATKALIAAIAAGGWIAIVVIVIICLIGLIASSAFGIFFSGEDTGTGQTMRTVVREINQGYDNRLDEIKTGNAHDVLEMSGSRAVWPEVLAVYAVKTTTDPDGPQEVATMDDAKKELLKEIFWAMNKVSYSSITAPHDVVTETDDGHGNIVETTETVTETTLYITVSQWQTSTTLLRTSGGSLQNYWLKKTAVYGAPYSMALVLATGRSSLWPFRRSGMWAVSPIGHGMALALAWIGALALYPGAPTSADILTLA